MPEVLPVVNNTKNPVQSNSSPVGDIFTIYGVSRVSRVSRGLGLLYFWVGNRNSGSGSQFVLTNGTSTDYSVPEPNKIDVIMNTDALFPCSGIITGTQEGYIIAPAIQVGIPEGRDIVLMLLYPNPTPPEVSTNKTTLGIPAEDAIVTLSTNNGELRCLGNIIGHGFKAARIILNRNPGLPVYTDGFNETLCELRDTGSISAVWKPVTRTFEKCLLVLHPPSLSSFGMSSFYPTLTGLAQRVGAPEHDFAGTTPNYIVGDGVGVTYAVRLVVDRGLGRHFADEAILKIA